MFVYQEFWSSMVTRALIGIDGISGEIKYDPGWVKSRFLNGVVCGFQGGDCDDRR